MRIHRIEQRDLPLGESRTITAPAQDLHTEGRTLRGFAALYGIDSFPMHDRSRGRFVETIQRGAFADALAGEPDVVLTLNHDESRVLARTTSGTLRVRDEERGLAFEADLGDGPTAQDVREMVRRGDLSGCSFRFELGDDGETWAGERRTLTRVAHLHDLSLATVPAYGGARVELRSQPPAERGRLRVEDRTASSGGRPLESRIIDAVRSVGRQESRALTHAGTDPIQPDDLRRQLIDRLRERSVVIASGVPVLATDRKAVKAPLLTGDVEADWYDELQPITPSDPAFAEFELPVKGIKSLTIASNESIDDSDPSELQAVLDSHRTTLALLGDREMMAGKITSGKGVDGLLNLAGAQTLAIDGPLSWDDIVKATALLADAFVPGPFAVYTPGRAILALDTQKAEATSNLYAGRPVGLPPIWTTSWLPITTTTFKTTVIVAAPAMLTAVVRSAVGVEVDRSIGFDEDATHIRGRYRLGFGAAHPQAIVRLTGVDAPAIT